MTERFFIYQPVPTGETVPTDFDPAKTFAIYREADGTPLKWSASFALPEIGDKINITMNGIGPAIVQGYFASEGFLGVMTKTLKPPKWLRDQNKRDAKDMSRPEWYRQGIGCEFGTEIEPWTGKRKRVKPVTAADLVARGEGK